VAEEHAGRRTGRIATAGCRRGWRRSFNPLVGLGAGAAQEARRASIGERGMRERAWRGSGGEAGGAAQTLCGDGGAGMKDVLRV
jgi:hypothetical protein